MIRGEIDRLLEPLRHRLQKGVTLGPPPSPNRRQFPYQGTITFAGMRILVENPKGSVRRGVAPDGTAWATTMTAHYGEFAGTVGTDGDPVDVFVGENPNAAMAYVVHRKWPGTEVYDEDKVIVGVDTLEDAEALFRANYDRPGNLGGVTVWPIAELRAYLATGAHRGKRLDAPERVRELLEKGVLHMPLRLVVSLSRLHALLKAEQVGLFAREGDAAPRRFTEADLRARARAPRAAGAEQLGLFGGGAPAAPAPAPAAPAGPGPGWTPIPGSAHGGYHRPRAGGGFDYWYPGQGQAPGHWEDRAIVEPPKLARFVSPDGEIIDRDAPVPEGEFETQHAVIRYNDHKLLGVGSQFVGPDGHHLRVVDRTEHNYNVRLRVRNLTTGEEKEGGVYDTTSAINGAHERASRELSNARREVFRQAAPKHAAELEELHRRLVEAPSGERLEAFHNHLLQTKAYVAAANWADKQIGETFGVSPKMPRTFAKLREEYISLSQELRERFIGDHWQRMLARYPESNVLDAAGDMTLMRKLIRLRLVRNELDNYEPNRYRIDARHVAKHLPERDGAYSAADVVPALQKAIEEQFGEKLRKNQLKNVVIRHEPGTMYVSSTEPTNAAKLHALQDAADNSPSFGTGGVVFLEGGHYAKERTTNSLYTSDVMRIASEAVQDCVNRRGGEARPELYGDTTPEPVITLNDVVDALANLHESDTAPRLEVAHAAPHDPIVTAYVKTGRTKAHTYSDGTTVQVADEVQVTAPLSIVALAGANDAGKRIEGFRATHQARVAKLNERLAAVDQRLTDVGAHAQEAFIEWAYQDGERDPGEIMEAIKRHHGKKFDGYERDLWGTGYQLWRTVHPEKDAKISAFYQDKGDVTKAEKAKLGEEQAAYASRFRDHVASHVLGKIKAELGHTSDEDAARMAVHPQPDPSTLTPAAAKHAETLKDYDVEGDPWGLSRVWGFMSKDMIPHVDIAIQDGLGRAHCGGANSIRMEPTKKVSSGFNSTLAHEYGHAIEHDHPEVKELAQAMRDERGKGQARKRLGDLHGKDSGYDAHEVTYEDHWESAYTGKWYGLTGSTEVLSMGVEALFGDPVAFARRDRQHFLLTVGALSGMLGTTKKPVHPAARNGGAK